MSALEETKLGNRIDEKTKLIVFGYCRMNKSNTDIPSEVVFLCIKFYFQPEQFELSGDDISISDNNTKITLDINYPTGGSCSAYGHMIIPSISQYIYEWELKYNNDGGWNYVIVEISSSADYANRGFSDTRNESYGYGYWSPSGSKVRCKPGFYMEPSRGNRYGSKYGQGDIIKIKLNLIKKELSFFVNDKDQGIAWKDIKCNDDIQYRLAVTLTQQNSSVSIISFVKKECEDLYDLL